MTPQPCPICLEPVDERATCTLRCQHQVCAACFGQLRTPQCPICRQDIFEHIHANSEDDSVDAEADHRDYILALVRELQMHADAPPETYAWNPDEVVAFTLNESASLVYRVPLERLQRHFTRGRRGRARRRRRNHIQRVVDDAVKDLVSEIVRIT